MQTFIKQFLHTQVPALEFLTGSSAVGTLNISMISYAPKLILINILTRTGCLIYKHLLSPNIIARILLSLLRQPLCWVLFSVILLLRTLQKEIGDGPTELSRIRMKQR